MTSLDDERERVLETYDEAMSCLREGDLERAELLASTLKEARFTGAFEVLALVHLERDEPEAAETVLREGLALAPHVWLLWQLLGNILSDRERYDDADAAYTRALECPHVDTDSVGVNRAILRLRQGRPAEALDAAATIRSEPARTRARLARVDALCELARWEDAIAESESLLGDLAARDASDDGGLEARARAGLARALWCGRKDAAIARAALAPARLGSGALAAVAAADRAIDPRTSPRARIFGLLVEGRWPGRDEEGNELGFIRRYNVVADDPTAALAFAATYIVPDARASLTIDEYSDEGAAPDAPLGVRWVLGYTFYPLDGEDGSDEGDDEDEATNG